MAPAGDALDGTGLLRRSFGSLTVGENLQSFDVVKMNAVSSEQAGASGSCRRRYPEVVVRTPGQCLSSTESRCNSSVMLGHFQCRRNDSASAKQHQGLLNPLLRNHRGAIEEFSSGGGRDDQRLAAMHQQGAVDRSRNCSRRSKFINEDSRIGADHAGISTDQSTRLRLALTTASMALASCADGLYAQSPAACRTASAHVVPPHCDSTSRPITFVNDSPAPFCAASFS